MFDFSLAEMEPSVNNCSDGDVRLIGGSNEFEGTIEVCFNRVWGSVCGHYFSYPDYSDEGSASSFSIYSNVEEGQVVCGYLGYQRLGLLIISCTVTTSYQFLCSPRINHLFHFPIW